jgi:hypothetical protein
MRRGRMGVDLPSRYKGDMEELELDDVYTKMNSPKVVFDAIRRASKVRELPASGYRTLLQIFQRQS